MKNADMPAMPIEFSGFGQYAPEAYTGLSKREMFAMHAMQGVMFDVAFCQNHDLYDVAELAVKQADALLAELERTK